MAKSDVKNTLLNPELHRMLRDEECRQVGRITSHLRLIQQLWEGEAFFDDCNITAAGTKLLRYLCCEIIDAIDDVESRRETIASLQKALLGDKKSR